MYGSRAKQDEHAHSAHDPPPGEIWTMTLRPDEDYIDTFERGGRSRWAWSRLSHRG